MNRPPLHCPRCGEPLEETGTATPELRCRPCDHVYPVVLGIPDLRVFDDPYIDAEADRAKGLRVAERFDDTDFESLVRYYYSITDVVPAAHARRYAAGLTAAADRSATTLAAWERAAGARLTTRDQVLDAGCGTAPLAAALAARGAAVIGVDIAFRWLVVARKRLAQSGLDVPLVCACTEALPFAAGTFSVVTGESMIEVVEDQDRTLREIARVLTPGGRLWLTTPNRHSLGPDPHVGAPAGGWWPKAWLDAWARRHGAIPPRRTLLTTGRLARLLRGAGFAPPRCFLPDLTDGQRATLGAAGRAAAGLYQSLKSLPGMRQALLAIGPLFGAVTVRGGSTA